MSFRTCAKCGKVWEGFTDFLSDPEVQINGYQAFIPEPERGLILFTHYRDGCGTTISFSASELVVFYDIARFPDSVFGEKACEGRCLIRNDLEACDQNCSNRWVRDLIQVLRQRILPEEHPSKPPQDED